jgi:hypothetical protein
LLNTTHCFHTPTSNMTIHDPFSSAPGHTECMHACINISHLTSHPLAPCTFQLLPHLPQCLGKRKRNHLAWPHCGSDESSTVKSIPLQWYPTACPPGVRTALVHVKRDVGMVWSADRRCVDNYPGDILWMCGNGNVPAVCYAHVKLPIRGITSCSSGLVR